jgi:hypothetical protein
MTNKLIQLISVLFMLFSVKMIRPSRVDRTFPDKATRIVVRRMVNACHPRDGNILVSLVFVNDEETIARLIDASIDKGTVNNIMLVSMYPSNNPSCDLIAL